MPSMHLDQNARRYQDRITEADVSSRNGVSRLQHVMSSVHVNQGNGEELCPI